MKNESASALQKASFALLVFIAAALAYLIVRDYIGADRKSADSQSSVASSRGDTPLPANPPNPGQMKSSFAPLRPRVETNVVRVSPTRVVALPGNSTAVPSLRPVVDASMAPSDALPISPPQPVAAAITSGAASVPAGASILGRVTLRGTPPPEKPVILDALCGRLHPAPMTTRHYVVGADDGLGNVFVYVKSGIKPKKTSQPSIPVLDNVNCEFQPYVLGVRAGQPFAIRNSDSTLHNAHAISRTATNPDFNIGLPTKGGTVQRVFKYPEVFIQMKCEVHPWMFAYIGVVDHPWFAVTDTNGNFALPPGLPAGKYTIAAVHPKAGESVQQIWVNEGTPPTTSFSLEVPGMLTKAGSP